MPLFNVRNPVQTQYDGDVNALNARILALEQKVAQLEARLLQLSKTTATVNPPRNVTSASPVTK